MICDRCCYAPFCHGDSPTEEDCGSFKKAACYPEPSDKVKDLLEDEAF